MGITSNRHSLYSILSSFFGNYFNFDESFFLLLTSFTTKAWQAFFFVLGYFSTFLIGCIYLFRASNTLSLNSFYASVNILPI